MPETILSISATVRRFGKIPAVQVFNL